MGSLLILQVLAGLCVMAVGRVIWWVATTTVTAKKEQREAPQPPGALPLIGHLHLFRTGGSLRRTLGDMADRCGPVFMLRFGTRRAFVVSSCTAAEECFGANDRALASRPRSAAAEHMGYHYAMFGFAPYGLHWRSMRKLVTVELLSSPRVAALEPVRSMEISESIKELYDRWEEHERRPVVVDMKKWFKDLAFNIIVRAVAGKRSSGSGSGGAEEEMEKLKQAISQFFRLLGAFTPSDFLPFLRWADWGGHEKAMKSAARDMDAVVAAWLEEHRRRRLSGSSDGDGDLMDVLLSVMDDPDSSEHEADKNIKATSMAMILGGNDTTAISLTTNLVVFLNNPEVLRKAREELDLHVGRHRNVQEADVKSLVYLQAVVKETFRLYPTAEISQPHEAMEDCNIAGFHVAAGTRVLANIWKLQRDPAAWPDPEAYRPERFMWGQHEHVDVKGRHFELIPFGAGRRMCPGVSFALHVMHLALARLIHGFELGTLHSAGAPMETGDALFGPAPLEVVLTPRLPPELYR